MLRWTDYTTFLTTSEFIRRNDNHCSTLIHLDLATAVEIQAPQAALFCSFQRYVYNAGGCRGTYRK